MPMVEGERVGAQKGPEIFTQPLSGLRDLLIVSMEKVATRSHAIVVPCVTVLFS